MKHPSSPKDQEKMFSVDYDIDSLPNIMLQAKKTTSQFYGRWLLQASII